MYALTCRVVTYNHVVLYCRAVMFPPPAVHPLTRPPPPTPQWPTENFLPPPIAALPMG